MCQDYALTAKLKEYDQEGEKLVVTFVSNYINHHQLPFCKAMERMNDVEFHFIQTSPMEEKRVSMGWGVDTGDYSFVSLFYEEKEKCTDLILNSDVTILGWSDGIIADIEEKRLSSGKLTFRVSERIYREGQWKFISPRGLKNKYREHTRYRNHPVYLLCAGAYVASDFALIHSYPGKMLKWGYFPDACQNAESREYCADGKLRICWAGRLITLKHPEYAVKVAGSLRDKNIDFSMDIIGDGDKRKELEELIAKDNLGDRVILHGVMKPEEVTAFMRRADIFLFTSNYLEGWGAVVNEAMQSGCAVVASGEAGAVPYLIKAGENGLSYPDGNVNELIKNVLYLAENRDKIKEFGNNAANDIRILWNADKAALELIRFSKEYLGGNEPKAASFGPMSKAEILKAPGVLRTIVERNRLE